MSEGDGGERGGQLFFPPAGRMVKGSLRNVQGRNVAFGKSIYVLKIVPATLKKCCQGPFACSPCQLNHFVVLDKRNSVVLAIIVDIAIAKPNVRYLRHERLLREGRKSEAKGSVSEPANRGRPCRRKDAHALMG